MSDPQRAKVLLEYSQKLKDQHADGDTEVLQDIWHSSLIKDLKEKKGLFKKDTDLALGLAGDRVAIFSKKSKEYKLFPLVITNFNIPPSSRVKRNNMILVGKVPGPREPDDLDLFLLLQVFS